MPECVKFCHGLQLRSVVQQRQTMEQFVGHVVVVQRSQHEVEAVQHSSSILAACVGSWYVSGNCRTRKSAGVSGSRKFEAVRVEQKARAAVQESCMGPVCSACCRSEMHDCRNDTSASCIRSLAEAPVQCKLLSMTQHLAKCNSSSP